MATIPYGSRIFQIDFDCIAHELLIQTSEGARRAIALSPRSVADFYRGDRDSHANLLYNGKTLTQK